MRPHSQRELLYEYSKIKEREKFILKEREKEEIELNDNNKVNNSLNEKEKYESSKCKTYRPYVPTFIRDKNNKIIKKSSAYQYQNNKYGNNNEKSYTNNNRYKLINQSQDSEREKVKSRNMKLNLNTTYDIINNYKNNNNRKKDESVNKSSNDKNIDDDFNFYYGNAYKRRRKYWSSKSSSRDNNTNDSNEKNRVSTFKRDNNLREDLKSTLNDTKNIIIKLPLSFISKNYVKLKLLPINSVSFISKKIICPIILPYLDNSFISKCIIISKILPINDISFYSKEIIKVKEIPLLNNHFISKKIIKSNFHIPILKKRNYNESKTNKFENIKPIEIIFKKLPINNLSFSSKKIYKVNKIAILPLCYFTKNKIKCFIIPKINNLFISKVTKQEIVFKIPNKDLLFITKERIEILKKPISINYYISKEYNYLFHKPLLKNSYISKEKIPIIKKPKLNECYISKLLMKIFKKPKINKSYISKNYIFQTQIIPLIKQCFISKKFIILGFKKPLIKESYITKYIKTEIIPFKLPIINKCKITKIIKTQKRRLSNLSSLSFIDNLDDKKSLNKEEINKTPKKENNEDINYKYSNSNNKEKISPNSLSKNLENSFGSLQDEILLDLNNENKINKQFKLEDNIKKRKEIEKEIEIQFDNFRMIKEINNSNNNNNINNYEFKNKKLYFTRKINHLKKIKEKKSNEISLNLSRSKNRILNDKKEIMSKSQQINNNNNKETIIPNLTMKIPFFKFDKNMLTDLKQELINRKKQKRKIKDDEYSKIKQATEKLNEVLLGRSCDNKRNNLESKLEIGTSKLEEIIFKKKKKKSVGQINIRKDNRYLHILEQEDKINKLNDIERILDNKFDINPNENNIILSYGKKANTPNKPSLKKLFKTSDKNPLIRKKKKKKKIPKSNSINLQFILSLKNYPHSLDNYQLPNKVIEHCKDLNNPSYLLNINLKSSEKKKSQISKIEKNKIKEKEEIKFNENNENNISQWARKDMSKENEKAENYIKELNYQMEKNFIKHDIISILNTLTLDNFNNVKNKLFNLLNKNNDNQQKFIEVILEKSIIENCYVILYAKLCKELINNLNVKNECYLKNKLIEACKSSFDKIDYEINSKSILNDEQYYNQKKKILGNINLIADLIDVKILSQKIGFYCINTLYDRYLLLKNKNEKSMKFIYLEAIITFLSKYGKIIIKRNKKEHIHKLKNFIYEKISNIKEEKNIPGFLKYKIINLIEKEKNNWEDTLFEKSIIPKGKEKTFLENEKKIIEFEDEDTIKEDLINWIKYLNENDIISPSKLEEEILNEYEWENIDKLIVNEKVELVEIIRCYLEVSIDLINKKEDIFKANKYINSVIQFYSKYLSQEEINDCNKKLILLFNEVNNLVVDNIFMFEILGNLLYNSIYYMLFNITDLNVFIESDEITLKNICNVIKYSIESSGKNKSKFINDLKQINLFNNNKELLKTILNDNNYI